MRSGKCPHAAKAYGYEATVEFNRGSIRVAFETSPPMQTPLFEAISVRQTTRNVFDGQVLDSSELSKLTAAASGAGVQCLVFTGREEMKAIEDFVIQGNTIQMNDRKFVNELTSWIRTSYSEAMETSDCLFGITSDIWPLL